MVKLNTGPLPWLKIAALAFDKWNNNRDAINNLIWTSTRENLSSGVSE